MTKQCNGECKKYLEVNEENFYKNKKAAGGFMGKCKECFKEEMRDYSFKRYQEDPDYRARKIEQASARAIKRHTEDRLGFNAYTVAHNRVRNVKGKASQHLCSCGQQAKDWAMNNDSLNVKESKHYKWSTNVDDYKPMCRSCHKRYDLKEVAA